MSTSNARFLTGSPLRHVIVMTMTNTIGLMALFVVDLVDLYFLNLLGEQEMAASVGFSGQILFFLTAMSIGLLVAMSVLVSQKIGAKDSVSAKRFATNTYISAFIVTSVSSLVALYYIDSLLMLLGAEGRTLELAITYSVIILPSTAILSIGMVSGGVLRAIGDAKRSMKATLIGAFVNLALDPLLIFYFDMGIAGAAWATVISRFAMMFYGLYTTILVHKMISRPKLGYFITDIKPIFKFAGPTILTNLATPLGSAFVVATIAQYGDAAVAAYATIGRIIPVAFGTLFALSGAIGPIIGQNYGAKAFPRVRSTFKSALLFSCLVVVIVCTLLFFGQNLIISWFKLSSEAAELLSLFCSGIALLFIFDGMLFSTNAAFNSLGYPLYSTFFNYAKVIFGIIPFVWFLSQHYQAKGVIIGQSVGTTLISITALFFCWQLIKKIEKNSDDTPDCPQRFSTRPPLWPTSSAKSQV